MTFKHRGFGTVSDADIASRNRSLKKMDCDVCGGVGGHVNERTDGQGYSQGEGLCDHCGADLDDQAAVRAGH